MIVDVLHDPENLRAALTALLRQVGGKAAIPGRDADWAALGVKGRPRPQVRATRDAEPSRARDGRSDPDAMNPRPGLLAGALCR